MKFKGYFNSPNDKILSHYGELNIDKNNKIILSLFSNYSDKDLKSEVSKRIETLYGKTCDGTLITLSGAFSTKGDGSEIYKRIINYRYCLIGEHRSINEELIKNYKIEFSNLLGLFAVETFSLDQRNPPNYIKKEIAKNDDFEINLIAGIKTSSSSASSNIPTNKVAVLEFKRSSSLNIFELIKETTYLQFLLTILSQRNVYFSRLYIPKTKQRFEQIEEKSILYINNAPYSSRKNLDQIKTIKFRPSIQQNLGDIINDWFQYKQKWNSIIELLMTGTFNPIKNNISTFFSLITAIESWNRIKKKLPSKTLNTRLHECSNDDILDIFRDKNNFLQKCVAQRNYIAHNLSEEEEPTTFLEIITINLILKILLEELILLDLKVDKEDIIYLLKKGETYNQLMYLRMNYSELRI